MAGPRGGEGVVRHSRAASRGTSREATPGTQDPEWPVGPGPEPGASPHQDGKFIP